MLTFLTAVFLVQETKMNRWQPWFLKLNGIQATSPGESFLILGLDFSRPEQPRIGVWKTQIADRGQWEW